VALVRSRWLAQQFNSRTGEAKRGVPLELAAARRLPDNPARLRKTGDVP
jgi:hypothetical protein